MRATTPTEPGWGYSGGELMTLAYALAYTFVCVNVAIAVGAGVCYILQVINQARNQAASKITPRGGRGREGESLHFHSNIECCSLDKNHLHI